MPKLYKKQYGIKFYPHTITMAKRLLFPIAVVIFLCLVFGTFCCCAKEVVHAEYRGELIGIFTTSFSGSNEARIKNIKKATERIDGVVVKSGEVFSFNGVTGERTKENGYEPSPVIEYGKYTVGYGGGVCQVSTTLYNAIIRAGLKVLTVSSHSLPVSYVAPSMDAMVSKTTDFRFVNNTPYPVTIEGEVKNREVLFAVYGFRTVTDGEEIKFKSVVKNILKAEYEIKPDEENVLSEDKESKIIKPSKDGLISECYKEVYYQGKLISSTLYRTDKYAPQNGVMLVRKSMDT